MSVDSNCDLTENDVAVSLLLACRTGLPDGNDNITLEQGERLGNVITNARLADPHAVADYFAHNVMGHLDPNKRKLAFYALRGLVSDDENIDDDVIVDLVNDVSKIDFLTQSDSENNLSGVFAGIFLYTASIDNRIGKESIAEIDEDYVNSFKSDSSGNWKDFDVTLLTKEKIQRSAFGNLCQLTINAVFKFLWLTLFRQMPVVIEVTSKSERKGKLAENSVLQNLLLQIFFTFDYCLAL
jgi:hypothetical protein